MIRGLQTSGLLVAALTAALLRAGPATDVPWLVAADGAVELLQSRVSAARAGGDTGGTKSRPGSTSRNFSSPHARPRGAETVRQEHLREGGLAGFQTKGKRALGVAGAAQPPAGTFNCSAHPRLCMEPFSCSGKDISDFANAFQQVATGDGPNFGTWCFFDPGYEDYVAQCIIDNDLVGAGHTYHDQAKEGRFGPDTYDFDASYCFLEGFCLNTAVTSDTTVDEATHMCNQRYGDRWRTAGPPTSSPAVIEFIRTRDPSKPGFTSQDQTTPFILAACIMGNYHCDVVMCKATHCQDPEMVAKYGHFLTDLSWDENTEPWQVGMQ